MCNLGTFQTAASGWDSAQVRLCLCPLRAEAQFSTALLDTLSTGFQSQMLWALVFLVQVPWAVEPNVGSDPLLPPGGPLRL